MRLDGPKVQMQTWWPPHLRATKTWRVWRDPALSWSGTRACRSISIWHRQVSSDRIDLLLLLPGIEKGFEDRYSLSLTSRKGASVMQTIRQYTPASPATNAPQLPELVYYMHSMTLLRTPRRNWMALDR